MSWFWHLPESTSPTSSTQSFGELEDIEAKKEGMTEGLGDLDHEDTPPRPSSPCHNCGLDKHAKMCYKGIYD